MTVADAKKSPSKKKGDGENKINEIISEGTGQIVKMEVDCSAIVEEKIPLVSMCKTLSSLTLLLQKSQCLCPSSFSCKCNICQ